MKNRIIVALALSISVLSFAQKKELKTADKAIKGANYAEAKVALKQAESLLVEGDAKLNAKFNYLSAKALYAGGAGSLDDIDTALDNLSKIDGLLGPQITELKQTMINGILTKGNDTYEKKEFSTSSKYFEKAYRLSVKDTIYLYYAAATAINVQEFDRALVIYEELKDLGYTGVTKQYFAVNKETEKKEPFDSEMLRNLSVKSKSHINPTEKLSESKKPEIVKNIAIIYVNNGENEKAIAAMKEARAESPDDVNLILSEANVHYKMGNIEEFKKLLEKATQMDPTNPELQYNLGVISGESGELEASRKYYEKTIELDPKYINAYINLSALILGEEESIIEEMNGLGTSRADNKRYDALRAKRQDLYRKAVPYLTKAMEIDSENISAAKTLMNIYSILGETDKYKAMKEIADALSE